MALLIAKELFEKLCRRYTEIGTLVHLKIKNYIEWIMFAIFRYFSRSVNHKIFPTDLFSFYLCFVNFLLPDFTRSGTRTGTGTGS